MVGMGLRLKLRIITAHMQSTRSTTKGMPMMYPVSVSKKISSP